MVAPGIFAGADADEAIAALRVRERAPGAGKIRIEGDVCKTAGSAGGDGALISPAAS